MSLISTVAVVEDDDDICANVCRFLQHSGFRSWSVSSAEDFYVSLLNAPVDLVVVDIGLPGESGLSLISRLAGQGIPCIVMTARADLDARIEGLEAGALQYFVKPVDLHELVAGIRSQLRQVKFRAATSMQASIPWRLDVNASSLVAPDQKRVDLTTRELELLHCLIGRGGALVKKQELVDAMGGGEVDEAFHRIESVLTRLRKKTLDVTGSALPVRAVFGKGLVFVR